MQEVYARIRKAKIHDPRARLKGSGRITAYGPARKNGGLFGQEEAHEMCQRFKRRGERDSGAEEEVHLALVRTRNDLRTRWLEGHDEGEMRGRPRGPGDASGGTEGWHGSEAREWGIGLDSL